MDNINLFQLISALSFAIDLAETSISMENDFFKSFSEINTKHKFLNHSKRTSYISLKLALEMSKENDFLRKVFIASSLHDIGAAGFIDESHTESRFVIQHSMKGSDLIKKLPLMDDEVSSYIKFHHENYNGSGPFGLKGDEIPLISQIIRLADTFELLYNDNKPNYVQREKILSFLKDNEGHIFAPYVFDIFLQIQSKDAFWWDIENISSLPDIIEKVSPNISVFIGLIDLKNIAQVFADIIDTKSPFTFKHSTNLTKLISNASDYLGFNTNKKTRFEISALMHDIGKLAIPNSILDKNGKLTDKEFTIMKSHTYYTRAVLSRINGFSDITNWAANHHEKLSGRGYPFGIEGNNLSLEERIMSVCDMYEALTADRPYRKGMSKDDALKIIDNSATNGDICNNAVNILKEII
ncbi:HD-GYP domain-containing protein [Fervidicella metallireducens]|uniref:HD-GYP domain-containing protein n=1 Tax=Fervidicella metallireducens TaxID=655338 RepID=UPI00055509F9|nr:HD domain-containing phosphohydrolase [Fervidicella metallireducens]